MFRLGQRVIIVGDQFEQNLPIGSYGYIIAYDKNPDTVYEYVIRVPKMGRHYYVPGSDIELEKEIIKREAERVEKEALINYALATRNKELFYSVLNSDEDEMSEEKKKEAMSHKEFIRQVNLKAWI